MAKGRDKLTSFIMQEEALINPERLYLSPARGAFVFGSHLHLQHLVENGLGEAFVDVSLLSLLDQLVSVLFVWDDTPAASDLETEAGSAEVSRCFQTKVTRNYFNVSPQFLMFFFTFIVLYSSRPQPLGQGPVLDHGSFGTRSHRGYRTNLRN